MTHRRRQPSDELMQRISSAMDADGGVDADAELRALLDRDPDGLLYAQDLVRIDEVLADLGKRAREPDWDALAARIEAELDGEGEALEGFDAPPRFLDDDAREVRPRDVSQEVPVAAAPIAPRPEPEASDAKVVDLASRRRSTVFAWTGGLAAAAAVGLGIVFGTAGLGTTFDAAPSSESAAYEMAEEAAPMAPSAQAVAPAPAMPAPAEAPAWDDLAEGEASAEPLPAAAVVIGGARGASGGAPAPAPLAPPMRGDGMDGLARAPAAEPPRGAAPGRAEVLTTLRDVEPAVQRCLARAGEVARVTMQVGVAGNVVSARVDPPYAGADAACIVDAVRGARLPPSPEGYVLVHAFRPAPVAGGALARPANASRAARQRAPARPAQRAEGGERPPTNEVIDAFGP